jgi:hypothetical protein
LAGSIYCDGLTLFHVADVFVVLPVTVSPLALKLNVKNVLGVILAALVGPVPNAAIGLKPDGWFGPDTGGEPFVLPGAPIGPAPNRLIGPDGAGGAPVVGPAPGALTGPGRAGEPFAIAAGAAVAPVPNAPVEPGGTGGPVEPVFVTTPVASVAIGPVPIADVGPVAPVLDVVFGRRLITEPLGGPAVAAVGVAAKLIAPSALESGRAATRGESAITAAKVTAKG